MMLSRDSVADAFLFSRLCRTDAFRFIAFGCRGADGVSSFEVDADIVGSAAARRILSVVKSATSELVLDLALVVEGATPEDLPEQVLGAVRLHRVDPALALALELCPLASG